MSANDKLRGGSRTTATSKMERFVIIVNGIQPLTIITKRSILDVAVVLDAPLKLVQYWQIFFEFLIFCIYFLLLKACEISRKV